MELGVYSVAYLNQLCFVSQMAKVGLICDQWRLCVLTEGLRGPVSLIRSGPAPRARDLRTAESRRHANAPSRSDITLS